MSIEVPRDFGVPRLPTPEEADAPPQPVRRVMEPKPITPWRAVRCIVSLMCRHGHMNGWMGDISQEFRTDRVNAIMSLPKKMRIEWLRTNRSNILRGCGCPERIYNMAQL